MFECLSVSPRGPLGKIPARPRKSFRTFPEQPCPSQRKQWGRFCYVSQSETAEPSPAVSADKASGTPNRPHWLLVRFVSVKHWRQSCSFQRKQWGAGAGDACVEFCCVSANLPGPAKRGAQAPVAPALNSATFHKVKPQNRPHPFRLTKPQGHPKS